MDLGLFHSVLRSPQTMLFPVGSEKNALNVVEEEEMLLYFIRS